MNPVNPGDENGQPADSHDDIDDRGHKSTGLGWGDVKAHGDCMFREYESRSPLAGI
jgi:hypothetical protein